MESKISLEDEEVLSAFQELPEPPGEKFADQLAAYEPKESSESPVTEEELRDAIPFLRMAWLWLTAQGHSNLVITSTFLGLRHLLLQEKAHPDELRPSDKLKQSPFWAEVGTDLLRCTEAGFLEVVEVVMVCCPEWGRDRRIAGRFLKALLKAAPLRGLGEELQRLLAPKAGAASRPGPEEEQRKLGPSGARNEHSSASLPGPEEEQRKQLGDFLAAWLARSSMVRPADIIQTLQQEKSRAQKGKLVPGQILPVGVLERLLRQSGERWLLRCAWEHPELELVTRHGDKTLRAPKEAGVAWEKVQQSFPGVRWEIYPGESSQEFGELDLRVAAARAALEPVG